MRIVQLEPRDARAFVTIVAHGPISPSAKASRPEAIDGALDVAAKAEVAELAAPVAHTRPRGAPEHPRRPEWPAEAVSCSRVERAVQGAE